jgi:pimeloyl-ACP methyl ester carboxylesterase
MTDLVPARGTSDVGPIGERLEISISVEILDDLGRRLGATRLAPAFPDDGWEYGASADFLAELVSYWRDGYDWRARESAMNELRHRRVIIDGVPIHYVHETGVGPDPVPLVLTHGWPWTFWDYREVIGPLSDPARFGGDPADAFDVVVPSLPGYGFSSPLPRPGINFWVTADLWARLMGDVLGYERFAAHGSDWGMYVTGQLGHKHADRLIGAHLTGTIALPKFNPTLTYRPWSDFLSPLRQDVAPGAEEALVSYERRRAGHLAVQMSDPQSMAHAMHDSPAGLAAWLVQRRYAWGDCQGDIESRFSKEALIDNAMLYWVTDTFASSIRFYAEATRYPWQPSHDRRPVIEAPTGYTFFQPDRPPGLGADRDRLAEYVNLQYLSEHPTGGHFAPVEEPEALVHDIREFFQPLRRP